MGLVAGTCLIDHCMQRPTSAGGPIRRRGEKPKPKAKPLAKRKPKPKYDGLCWIDSALFLGTYLTDLFLDDVDWRCDEFAEAAVRFRDLQPARQRRPEAWETSALELARSAAFQAVYPAMCDLVHYKNPLWKPGSAEAADLIRVENGGYGDAALFTLIKDVETTVVWVRAGELPGFEGVAEILKGGLRTGMKAIVFDMIVRAGEGELSVAPGLVRMQVMSMLRSMFPTTIPGGKLEGDYDLVGGFLNIDVFPAGASRPHRHVVAFVIDKPLFMEGRHDVLVYDTYFVRFRLEALSDYLVRFKRYEIRGITPLFVIRKP